MDPFRALHFHRSATNRYFDLSRRRATTAKAADSKNEQSLNRTKDHELARVCDGVSLADILFVQRYSGVVKLLPELRTVILVELN